MTNNQCAHSVFKQFVTSIEERVKNKRADRRNLIMFLRKAKSAGLVESDIYKRLVPSAKEYLFSDLEWIDDYKDLTGFLNLFPDVVCEEERESIRSSFVEFASEFYLGESDPDVIRTDADELRSIGEALGVNVSRQVELAESRAAEIEEEAPGGEEENYDYTGYAKLDYYSNEDIKSMFGTMQL